MYQIVVEGLFDIKKSFNIDLIKYTTVKLNDDGTIELLYNFNKQLCMEVSSITSKWALTHFDFGGLYIRILVNVVCEFVNI